MPVSPTAILLTVWVEGRAEVRVVVVLRRRDNQVDGPQRLPMDNP